MAASMSHSGPRFVNILAARASTSRPSELEVHLRAHCQKLVIKEDLSGAHFVFLGVPSIGVRAYYPQNIQTFEKSSTMIDSFEARQALKLQAVHEPAVEATTIRTTGGKQQLQYQQQEKTKLSDRQIGTKAAVDENNDIDGIRAFCSQYTFSLILFVLPRDYMQEQLERMDSFTNRIMHHLEEVSTTKTNATSNNNPSDNGSSGTARAKIMVVETPEQAIQAITTMADCLAPQKSKLKMRFLERQQHIDLQETAMSAFRQLEQHFGLVEGEADILMQILGSLENIVTADEATWHSLPCENETKEALVRFFHGVEWSNNNDYNNDALHDGEIQETQTMDAAMHADQTFPADENCQVATMLTYEEGAPAGTAMEQSAAFAAAGNNHNPYLRSEHGQQYEQGVPDQSSYDPERGWQDDEVASFSFPTDSRESFEPVPTRPEYSHHQHHHHQQQQLQQLQQQQQAMRYRQESIASTGVGRSYPHTAASQPTFQQLQMRQMAPRDPVGNFGHSSSANSTSMGCHAGARSSTSMALRTPAAYRQVRGRGSTLSNYNPSYGVPSTQQMNIINCDLPRSRLFTTSGGPVLSANRIYAQETRQFPAPMGTIAPASKSHTLNGLPLPRYDSDHHSNTWVPQQRQQQQQLLQQQYYPPSYHSAHRGSVVQHQLQHQQQQQPQYLQHYQHQPPPASATPSYQRVRHYM